MIAYKTFFLCPISQRPSGIPLAYPWIQQSCEPEEEHELRKKGWSVVSEDDYVAYVDSLADILIAWQAEIPKLGIKAVINEAISFGNNLLSEFAAENVLLQITQEGKTGEVLDKLSRVMEALQAGSLYEAIYRIKALNPADYDAKFVSEARLLQFVNKIEAYLNLPLSTSLGA